MARLLGPGRAKELILTGRRVNAAEAFSIGLVEQAAWAVPGAPRAAIRLAQHAELSAVKQYLDRTFLPLGRGFQFSAEPPPALASAEHLASRDSWTVLGSVLARVRQGDLRAVEVLPDLMARDDGALVWNACVQLIGFAGRTSFVLDTAERFLSRPDELGIQWSIGDLLRNGCSLRAVEPLLRLHAAATDRDARRHVERCLSTLLEEQPGELDDGAEEQEVPDPAYPEPFTQTMTVLDRAGHAAQVREAAAEVASRLASRDQAVTAGLPLDLEALVRRLHERIRSGEPSGSRMEWERMCFEASTGVDCTAFYEQGRLRRLAALAILEDFMDAGHAAAFEPGVRYFFGHRVDE
ncbi:hypothetical protein [Archangium violaceum]|uniref:hypothetical protein n=1 Tax=Archangium violaceum TaxID=83451 RepID=UPI001EF65545|nr:hypothetical protein [Archangium violaceum]